MQKKSSLFRSLVASFRILSVSFACCRSDMSWSMLLRRSTLSAAFSFRAGGMYWHPTVIHLSLYESSSAFWAALCFFLYSALALFFCSFLSCFAGDSLLYSSLFLFASFFFSSSVHLDLSSPCEMHPPPDVACHRREG